MEINETNNWNCRIEDCVGIGSESVAQRGKMGPLDIFDAKGPVDRCHGLTEEC
jgi:hypothetical protein